MRHEHDLGAEVETTGPGKSKAPLCLLGYSDGMLFGSPIRGIHLRDGESADRLLIFPAGPQGRFADAMLQRLGEAPGVSPAAVLVTVSGPKMNLVALVDAESPERKN